MSRQLADPHASMLSFQQGLLQGILDISRVRPHDDLYSHFDEPARGVGRLTYVRLDESRKKVRAFISCIMNGQEDGAPCIAVGYAVPKALRGKGLAKLILQDAIKDQVVMAGRAGHAKVLIEAVIDVENVPSQRVAEFAMKVEREPVTDNESQRPAYRYTATYETATGRQLDGQG
ncbi:GNAT family N-acetyltransferase [Achromobacter kerstersii]|uniref:GNAT family N-acetyltransferase n=1 Tax=Achromobacter kerstersii TaxID=1353890 RepID=UPI00313E5D13